MLVYSYIWAYSLYLFSDCCYAQYVIYLHNTYTQTHKHTHTHTVCTHYVICSIKYCWTSFTGLHFISINYNISNFTGADKHHYIYIYTYLQIQKPCRTSTPSFVLFWKPQVTQEKLPYWSVFVGCPPSSTFVAEILSPSC